VSRLQFRKDVLLKTMIAACVTGFCVSCIAKASSDSWDATHEILFAVYLTGGRGAWHPIFSLVPIITSCLPLLGYLSDDMATQTAYVFPRANKRGRWIWRQYGNLFSYVVAAGAVYLTTISAVTFIFGAQYDASFRPFMLFGQLLPLTILFWFALVLFINLCALCLPISAAFLTGMGVNAVLAWVPPTSSIVFVIPMTHYYLDLHAGTVLQGIYFENTAYSNWFNLQISIIYWLALLIVLGFGGQWLLQHTEFALRKRSNAGE
jgi:hypothetical protein